MNDRMKEVALGYAGMGWSVFPLHSVSADGACTCGGGCSSPAKHPRTKDGFKSASTDQDAVAKFWDTWPDANIGIRTGRVSNIFVVDVDEAKGADLEKLFKRFGGDEHWKTATCTTGRGRHFYFKLPVGVEVRNSASKLAVSVDVRGEGGYVVAPPSVHILGDLYDWEHDYGILGPPPGLLDALGEKQAVTINDNGLIVPQVRESLVVPEIIQSGARNDSLAQVAGKLRSLGLVENEIAGILLSLNERLCSPALPQSEVGAIARSIARYENDALETVGEVEGELANDLQVFKVGELLKMDFPEKEILALEIGAGDVAMFSGATNSGKSTMLRNLSLAMAGGIPFEPFVPGHRPLKVLYLDFETDAADLKREFSTMSHNIDADAWRLASQNLVLVPKGLIKGSLYQINTHWDFTEKLIGNNKFDIVVVDNVSAAFDLKDENSNAEVTSRIIKPLHKLSRLTGCATVFVHHYGKQADSDSVYAARGASALMSLVKSVYNISGNCSKDEPITVHCVKRKTGGDYSQSFRLDGERRWFDPSELTISVTPKRRDFVTEVFDAVKEYHYPLTVSYEALSSRFVRDTGGSSDKLKKALSLLVNEGQILRPKKGHYSAISEGD
jgi:hypothetical protein